MPKKVQWITKKCANCDKKISRPPSQFPGKNTCCSRKCNAIFNARYKKDNHEWKGGRIVENTKGYILVLTPNHHRARKNGYVLEHIIVMEQKLGRKLNDKERVHHIDHNPANNHPDNLKLYSSNSEHLREEGHHREKHQPCKCGKPHKGHGLCARHLAQFRSTGKSWDFENKLIRKNRPKFCHCGKPVKARNLCSKHYQQWRKENKNTNISKGYTLDVT